MCVSPLQIPARSIVLRGTFRKFGGLQREAGPAWVLGCAEESRQFQWRSFSAQENQRCAHKGGETVSDPVGQPPVSARIVVTYNDTRAEGLGRNV